MQPPYNQQYSQGQPAQQQGTSVAGALLSAFSLLWALSGSVMWLVFSFAVSAVSSRGSFNREPMGWMMLLGGPLLLIGFVLAIAGLVVAIRGNQKKSVLFAIGSFVATSIPGFSLVAGYFIASM